MIPHAPRSRSPARLHAAVDRDFLTLAQALAQEPKVPDTPEQLHIAPPPSDRFPAKWYLRVGDGTDVLAAPVLDRPFEATVETVTLYKSPEGETTPYIITGFRARDRLGRIRNDSVNGGMTIEGQTVKTKIVMVADRLSLRVRLDTVNDRR